MKDSALIARLHRDYFSDPSRTMRVPKGHNVIDMGIRNDRLYYVLSGTFAGTIPGEDDLGNEERVELFRSGPGDFIGAISFFSRSQAAFMRVTAITGAEIAWIDLDTPPVNEEEYGDIPKQFLPVIMEELVQRQFTLSRTAHDREAALHRLHLSENLSTLGRLSAGIAHELNNAIGVLSRTSDHLQHVIQELLHANHPQTVAWFERGLAAGQEHSSEAVRTRGKELAQRFDLPYAAAKGLARAIGNEDLTALPEDLDAALNLWETGRACHDMQLAARHAEGIVKSVKELGGSSRQRAEGVDVNASLREAVSLLKSYLRKVTVHYELAEDLPFIWGNTTELAQIWINILRNACDAIVEAKTPSPAIHITSRAHKRGIEVIISNNGPPIPEGLLRRLFQPHITTKRGAGGVMGMGLGLYLIKRLVDSYCGELFVESTTGETKFSIHLPFRHEELDLDT